MHEAPSYETLFMPYWLGVVAWFAVVMAIIFPIAWFLIPSAKSRRESSRRRPVEPDTLEADIKIFRWLSFLLMYFFWLMLVIFVSASASVSTYKELELDVAVHDPAPPIASMPVISISDEGEVVFLELRLPPEDHDLEALQLRLRDLRPLLHTNEPALIRPEPETTHQRIIEVLSAVQRARIRESILL
ncbi:MAG TPA: hypothetical protein VGO11_08640 [Chthoniobacteraceae bacterium]|nr:hypothetical protein [Chthoniobacteraceae bacterium]